MGVGAKIHVLSSELIKPSSPTPNERRNLKLSFLDQSAPFSFIPLLFFYQKQPPSFSNILDPSCKTLLSFHLKQSLSESLTKFYPFAGKLNPDFLSFDCDDSGVLFVEAKVDAPLSESVENASFKSFGEFLPFEPFPADDEELLLGTYPINEILFGVQITRFECGSNAIGVCISHIVADFATLVTFMNSWAAKSRGESATITMNKSPDFEIGKNLFPPLNFSPGKVAPVAAGKGKGKRINRRFVFNKKKLAELKKLAISSSEVKDPSRVEVVTAFLWNQFIKIARTKHELDDDAMNYTVPFTFRVWHTVNLRSRMTSLAAADPLMFPSGNFATLSTASFTTSELDPDLNDLVWLTRTAIRKVNDDYVSDFMKSLKNPMRMVEHEQHLKTTMVTSDSFFTSWCRFSTYEADFGWGKPIWVGPAGTMHFGGVILTNTNSEEGGIEALINMLEDDLALLPDEILSLATTDVILTS